MLAMEDVYRDYAKTVYRYLLSLCRDAALAEELTQETFFRAVQGATRFDGKSRVSTWLCAIAKHVYLSERRRPPTAELDASTAASPSGEEQALSGETRLELLQKLHSLDADTREVLYLRLFGDLSFREVGAIFSKSENWARVTYFRGKEKLKKELESDG